MFNYFIRADNQFIKYPIIINRTKWDLVRKMYNLNNYRMIKYYRNNERFLNNNNMLVRMIGILRRVDMDVYDYNVYLDNEIPYTNIHFNLVSDRNMGIRHDGILSDLDGEIYLANDHLVDIQYIQNNWATHNAIKVISNNSTNLYYPMYPNIIGSKSDTTVFDIDVKALMLQYYYWANSRIGDDRGIDIGVFLTTIVMPNMIWNLTDMSVWNRFKNIVNNKESDNVIVRYPISLTDYTVKIDDMIRLTYETIIKTNTYISGMLRNILCMHEENVDELLHINKSYYTRQSKWVLWVSRIDDIVNIHKTLYTVSNSANRDLFGSLPHIIKNINNRESDFYHLLTKADITKFKRNIDYVREHIGKV